MTRQKIQIRKKNAKVSKPERCNSRSKSRIRIGKNNLITVQRVRRHPQLQPRGNQAVNQVAPQVTALQVAPPQLPNSQVNPQPVSQNLPNFLNLCNAQIYEEVFPPPAVFDFGADPFA